METVSAAALRRGFAGLRKPLNEVFHRLFEAGEYEAGFGKRVLLVDGEIGHENRIHACFEGGCDAMARVFEYAAIVGRDPEALSGGEENFGIRFSI